MASDGLDRPNRGWNESCLTALHNSNQYLLEAFLATTGISGCGYWLCYVEGTLSSDLVGLKVVGDESPVKGSSPFFFLFLLLFL